ncbi:MAG: alpha/beta hydrolase [Alphaproteobacteria bacterium]|nr:alpha/beta hydrolase [Alphaproteobacteria bacterium]
MTVKRMMHYVLVIALVYVCALAFMYFNQRSMLYYPDKSQPNPVAMGVNNVEIARVQTEDGLTLEGWYFAPSDSKKPVIVLFHGNAGNFAHRGYKASYYMNEGYGVLLAEYRGYGGNPGTPTEQGLYKDARAYLDWLKTKNNMADENIVIYGESIGTGVAVQMATEYNVKAVILEAAYSSTVDIAKNIYGFLPIKLLMKDQFLSVENIYNVHAPLLLVHGDKDITIPIALSRKLFDAANEPKTFINIPDAGHNNLYDHGAHKYILKFLKKY